MILIDACGLIALGNGGNDFSKEARRQLEAPGSRAFVSAMTAFEIGQKCASGKLLLPLPPLEWFEAMLHQHKLEELAVTSRIALAAADLPLIHRDPFDRVLVATALDRRLTILTSDRIIPAYPGVKVLW